MVVVIVCCGRGCIYMEVMVIYVWQCMVVLLYDCICARWLWSIMNEHATATINTLFSFSLFLFFLFCLCILYSLPLMYSLSY